MTYIQEIKKALTEINYCKNEWASDTGRQFKCDLDFLCQECQEKLCGIMQWADAEEDDGPYAVKADNIIGKASA